MALKGDQRTTRAMNRRLILNLLRRDGGLSRGEIAARTGLSNAAITGVVGDLMEQGFLKEGESSQSSGGRKPTPVHIEYGARFSIGLKLMEGRLEAVLTDLSTAAIATCVVLLADLQPERVAAAADEAVKYLLPEESERKTKLIGVGLAMPGLVDIESGVCLISHRFGWKQVPIAALLAERLHVPVWIDNDANAFAIAQQLFGHARHRSSALVLIIGTGVGAALIFDGQIHRGARYAAGEVGFAVDSAALGAPRENRQSWGNRFSEPAMVKAWQDIRARNVGESPADLQEAALAGDPRAVAYLGQTGHDIGMRLVTMIDLVDPEVVIVGGEAIRFGKSLVDPMIAAIQEYCFETPPPVEVDWENNIWSRGASALAIQQFFDFEQASGWIADAAQ
ncbi:ROK family protein [Mesorhizobium sp. M0830]|uniref:ROK family protein n=1 Tax=unclassified Mesorhizobium TaxID=325217 RepID=UPI0003CE5AE2|nr:ROK family protein [Mesorhizobium sp. LSHC412B00]ESX90841.1 ROK family transcriptional regulator [Mesorhizobium sp. LSHC412B00]